MKNPTKVVLAIGGLIILTALVYAALNGNKNMSDILDGLGPAESDEDPTTTAGNNNSGINPNTTKPISPTVVSTSVITNVLQVLTSPNTYVNNRIKLRGRLKVLTRKNTEVCDQQTGENCEPFVEINLAMVDPDVGENFFPDKVIPIYRKTSSNQPEAYRCSLVNYVSLDPIFNCGVYVPGGVHDLVGTVTKASSPITIYYYPPNSTKTVEGKSQYYLLLD